MAISNDLVQKMRKSAPSDKIILSLEEKGYCVSLLKDGTTVEKEAREVSEFNELIKTSSITWVDYVVENMGEEAQKLAVSLGFTEGVASTLLKSTRSGYEDLDNELGLLLPAIIVNGFDVRIEYILILMRPGLVATIHTTEVRRFFRPRRYAKKFMRKIKPTMSSGDKVTMVLVRIIDENNNRNFDHLREIEDSSDKLSEKLSGTEASRQELGKDIHRMKHALITYLNGLWETVDVLNTLRYGDPDCLTDDPKLLQRLAGLVVEVNYQIGLAEHMSEVLASGLEVMQSIYNNQLQVLNNKLALLVAYLTVIGTAVLVPNTLATALSNDAFGLGPEDMGWYVALLLVSTVLSTMVAYWWVKTRGLLPESPDGKE